jgi:hypothetical protein
MKRKLAIIAACIACIAVAWILTLGVTLWDSVYAYSEFDNKDNSIAVHVSMNPVTYTCGIPWLYAHYQDALSYPLEITVKVDDRTPGEFVVIESLEAKFDDGGIAVVITPEYPRGGPLAKYEPFEPDKVPDRACRIAWIGIPKAIHHRGSFLMTIKGYISGERRQPFERQHRMSYERKRTLTSNWLFLLSD